MDHEPQQGFIPLSYLFPWFDSYHYQPKLELTQLGNKVSPSTAATMTCATRVLLLNGKRYSSKRFAAIPRACTDSLGSDAHIMIAAGTMSWHVRMPLSSARPVSAFMLRTHKIDSASTSQTRPCAMAAVSMSTFSEG